MRADRIRWVPLWAAAALCMGPHVSAAAGKPPANLASSRFPEELIGQWEPGPRRCVLPLDFESDASFRIDSNLLTGYEHTSTPESIEKLSDEPSTWRITSTTRWDDNEHRIVEIYVLDGDWLAVVDGANATSYSRCEFAAGVRDDGRE